jgi:hypothetical protein
MTLERRRGTVPPAVSLFNTHVHSLANGIRERLTHIELGGDIDQSRIPGPSHRSQAACIG